MTSIRVFKHATLTLSIAACSPNRADWQPVTDSNGVLTIVDRKTGRSCTAPYNGLQLAFATQRIEQVWYCTVGPSRSELAGGKAVVSTDLADSVK